MKHRPGRGGWLLAVVLPWLTTGAVLADGSSGGRGIVGRLIDINGASVAGATVLVFPAAPSGVSAGRVFLSDDPSGPTTTVGEPAGASVLLRTDADGGFAVLLPPGRYMVAAVKRGYEVSMTEVHSLASRVLRMRLLPSAGAGRRSPSDPDADRLPWWEQRADVLRDEAPVPAPVLLIARQDGGGPRAGGAAGTAPRPARGDSRALLGSIDGDVVQSLGAGGILGLESGAPLDAERATMLSVRAPVGAGLGLSVEGRSLRSRSDLGDSGDILTGRSDRMLFTLDRPASIDRRLQGQVRAGFGNDGAGDGVVREGVLESSGVIGYSKSGAGVAIAVRAWSARSNLEGGYLTLDPGVPSGEGGRSTGEGIALYAGDRRDLGARTRIDYGLEYREDSLSGPARIVPRVGLTQQTGGGVPLAVRTEILLDPARPGGRVSVEGAPGNQLQIAASVAVLPANAVSTMPDGGAGMAAPGWGIAPAGASSAELREIDLSVARNFGPVSGSLGGSLGRTGSRSLPVVEEGPLPVVSFGGEKFYATRIGVAYRPWATEMQVAYRAVITEAGADPAGEAHDYHRIDLTVSQELPSPRSLLGARLRALVAWQGIDYDAAYTASGGSTLSGLATRLTGGVGLSF